MTLSNNSETNKKELKIDTQNHEWYHYIQSSPIESLNNKKVIDIPMSEGTKRLLNEDECSLSHDEFIGVCAGVISTVCMAALTIIPVAIPIVGAFSTVASSISLNNEKENYNFHVTENGYFDKTNSSYKCNFYSYIVICDHLRINNSNCQNFNQYKPEILIDKIDICRVFPPIGPPEY